MCSHAFFRIFPCAIDLEVNRHMGQKKRLACMPESELSLPLQTDPSKKKEKSLRVHTRTCVLFFTHRPVKEERQNSTNVHTRTCVLPSQTDPSKKIDGCLHACTHVRVCFTFTDTHLMGTRPKSASMHARVCVQHFHTNNR